MGVPKGSANGYLAKVCILDFDNAIVTCEENLLCATCYQERVCADSTDTYYPELDYCCQEGSSPRAGGCWDDTLDVETGRINPNSCWYTVADTEACYPTEQACYENTCFVPLPVLGYPWIFKTVTGNSTGCYYQQTDYFSGWTSVCPCEPPGACSHSSSSSSSSSSFSSGLSNSSSSLNSSSSTTTILPCAQNTVCQPDDPCCLTEYYGDDIVNPPTGWTTPPTRTDNEISGCGNIYAAFTFDNSVNCQSSSSSSSSAG